MEILNTWTLYSDAIALLHPALCTFSVENNTTHSLGLHWRIYSPVIDSKWHRLHKGCQQYPHLRKVSRSKVLIKNFLLNADAELFWIVSLWTCQALYLAARIARIVCSGSDLFSLSLTVNVTHTHEQTNTRTHTHTQTHTHTHRHTQTHTNTHTHTHTPVSYTHLRAHETA